MQNVDVEVITARSMSFPLLFTVLSDVEREIIACLGDFPGVPMLSSEIAQGCGYCSQRDMISVKLYTLVRRGYVTEYETVGGTHAFTIAGDRLRAVRRVGTLFQDLGR